MDAHFAEQRKGAAGRDGWVPSSLVTFCGASNRKSLAERRKRMLHKICQSIRMQQNCFLERFNLKIYA